MPPPRLSRHLRPCHPPVTAKQVRCVHATGRPKHSTAGNDTTPQTPSAKGSNGQESAASSHTDAKEDVSVQGKSWWEKALGRFASLGRQTQQSVSIESQPKPSSPHAEQPERPVTNLPGVDGSWGKEEQVPTQATVGLTTSLENEGTRPGQKRFTKRKTVHLASSEQAQIVAMRQQINQLSEQIRTLQDRLEAGLTTGQPSSTSAATPRTSAMQPSAPQTTRGSRDLDATQSDMQHQDPTPTTPIVRRVLAARRQFAQKVDRTLQLAQSDYERAVIVSGDAAVALTMLPIHTVAPVAPSILRRFHTIHRIAMMEDEFNIGLIYIRFKRMLDLLAFILRKSSIPIPGYDDPTVVDDAAKYSNILFHGNSLAHTLHGSLKRYHLSSRSLCEIHLKLKNIKSPAVVPMASSVRERILVIAEQAYREGDKDLVDVLGGHFSITLLLERARQSARKSIGLIMRLEAAQSFRRLKSHERVTRQLTREVSHILPGVPAFEYKSVVETTLVPRNHSQHGRAKDEQTNAVQQEEDGKRLMSQIHTQSWSMKSPTDLRMNTEDRSSKSAPVEQGRDGKDQIPSNRLLNAKAPTAAGTVRPPKPPPPPPPPPPSPPPPPRTAEVSERSLLEELFPEGNSTPQPQPAKKSRDQYPRLELPKFMPIVRPTVVERPQSLTVKATETLQQHGEQITVLQLTNCSTGLTMADFRRIMPKGKHLEGWRRDSDFYKVIPGRDPLSLERLPFYYLLFKNTEAALAYQKNASRLHKLSTRYQPSSILSAIPPPKGFLEDGEDVAAAVSSYNLLPKNHALTLNVLMQPYNPALRQLLDRGGYQPIEPSVDDKGKHLCRVLLHIEGYEPTPSDLFAAIGSDAYKQGILHPLRNESQSSIHRLRDMINLKMSTKGIRTSRPRAYGTFDHASDASSGWEATYDDPEIQSIMGGADEDRSRAQMDQEIMNRVYNRWILDFENVDVAERWSRRWHRRPLPDVGTGEATWKDNEEARICNTEVLW